MTDDVRLLNIIVDAYDLQKERANHLDFLLKTQMEALHADKCRLERENERLQAQLAAAVFQPVYDGGAHDREQMEQDAALGRLVRQMPGQVKLERVQQRWHVLDVGGKHSWPFRETPEEALRAAGVKDTAETSGASVRGA